MNERGLKLPMPDTKPVDYEYDRNIHNLLNLRRGGGRKLGGYDTIGDANLWHREQGVIFTDKDTGRKSIKITYHPDREGAKERIPIVMEGGKYYLRDKKNLNFFRPDSGFRLKNPNFKGFEVKSVMGKNVKDFRKVKGKKGQPVEDVGEWKRFREGQSKPSRPSAYNFDNIDNEPSPAQIEFYLPELVVDTGYRAETISKYSGIRTLSGLLKRKQKRREEARRQQEAASKFLKEDFSPINPRLSKPDGKIDKEAGDKIIGTTGDMMDYFRRPDGFRAMEGELRRRQRGGSSRRKPLSANIRRDARRDRAFSQRTSMRTDTGAKVESTEQSGFTQRTGAMTMTDISKYAPPTFHDRGIRDRRTAGGNIIRGGDRSAMRDIRHSRRYISATEQAIIDRKVRNTLAENKLNEEIKKVRDGAKEREEKLSIISQQKDKIIEDLEKKRVKLLHSHEVIAKSKMNATLLGSDAEELNKIIARGKKAGMALIKDMVRKGELTDRAVIGQLDITTNNKKSLNKLLDEGSEFIAGRRYFFKDFDATGRPITLSGTYRSGGERGSNVELLLDNGDTTLIRKRAILLPEDVETETIQPQLPPPPSTEQQQTTASEAAAGFSTPQFSFGGSAQLPPLSEEEQQEIRDNIYEGLMGGGGGGVISGGGGRPSIYEGVETLRPALEESANMWLDGEHHSSSSSSSSAPSFTEVEEEPNVAVARYNELLAKIPTDIKLINADQSEYEEIVVPEEGFFNKSKVRAALEKQLELRKRIEKRSKRVDKEISEVNRIAAEKGFTIPFQSLISSLPTRELRRASVDIPAAQLLRGQGQVETIEEEEPVIPITPELTPLPPPKTGEEEEGGGTLGEGLDLVLETDETDEEVDELTSPLEEEIKSKPEEDIEGFKREAEDFFTKEYADMEVSEDNPRYVRLNWEGLPLLVDTQTNSVIDPAGKFPMYKIKPFTKSSSINFIEFPSEEEKQNWVDYAKSVKEEKPPTERPRTPEVNEEGYVKFNFDRSNWKGSKLDEEKGKELDKLIGEDTGRLMIWSTRFPVEFKTPKRTELGGVNGIILDRSDFEAELDSAGITGKAKLNKLALFDKKLAEGKKEFALNDKKLLSSLGLISSASAVDFRGEVAGGLE